MQDFLADLADAKSASSVYERLVREVIDMMQVSSVHVMPFAPGPDGALGSVLYHRRRELELELPATIAPAIQSLQAEPGLPDLFGAPRRALRVEAALGWDRWLRSASYNEFFRRGESARQLVLGLSSASGAPLAFLAVCRSDSDEEMTRAEDAQVLALRDRVEQALIAFELTPDWSRPAAAILETISASLPVPALLIQDGRLTWMNREAQLRFGAAALTFGSNTVYVGNDTVRQLQEHVRAELRQAGASLARQARRGYDWLLPGETIIVRRVAGAGEGGVLVCLCAALPLVASGPGLVKRLQEQRLTAREADIASLAVVGYSVLSISSRLNIAESTGCTHLTRIYKKLGVRSRAELAWRLAGAPEPPEPGA
jgi:DNA-binding CsgD family transcriptional regulator